MTRRKKEKAPSKGQSRIKTTDGKNLTVIFYNGHKETLGSLKEYRDYIRWYTSSDNKET